MKYGIWQNIKYRLNYNKCVAHLQADLSLIPKPENILPLYVREMDTSSETDLRHWASIVTEAYDDKIYDSNDARRHFEDHLFLNISNVYFVMDENEPVGTISIGTYKTNNKIGGDARIAIRKEYQGRGLGKFVIAYGYSELFKQGIKYGESVISIPRSKSILLHFQCGFFPQLQKRHFIFSSQKRYWIIWYIVNRKLKDLYRSYLDSLSKKISEK